MSARAKLRTPTSLPALGAPSSELGTSEGHGLEHFLGAEFGLFVSLLLGLSGIQRGLLFFCRRTVLMSHRDPRGPTFGLLSNSQPMTRTKVGGGKCTTSFQTFPNCSRTF